MSTSMLKVTYFDYLQTQKQLLLCRYYISMCDGVVVEKNGKVVVFFANPVLCTAAHLKYVLERMDLQNGIMVGSFGELLSNIK